MPFDNLTLGAALLVCGFFFILFQARKDHGGFIGFSLGFVFLLAGAYVVFAEQENFSWTRTYSAALASEPVTPNPPVIFAVGALDKHPSPAAIPTFRNEFPKEPVKKPSEAAPSKEKSEKPKKSEPALSPSEDEETMLAFTPKKNFVEKSWKGCSQSEISIFDSRCSGIYFLAKNKADALAYAGPYLPGALIKVPSSQPSGIPQKGTRAYADYMEDQRIKEEERIPKKEDALAKVLEKVRGGNYPPQNPAPVPKLVEKPQPKPAPVKVAVKVAAPPAKAKASAAKPEPVKVAAKTTPKKEQPKTVAKESKPAQVAKASSSEVARLRQKTEILEAQIEAYQKNAIHAITPEHEEILCFLNVVTAKESLGSGMYKAVGKLWNPSGTMDYGRYQINKRNVGPWSQKCLDITLTPEQVMAKANLQDIIARCIAEHNFEVTDGYWDQNFALWNRGRRFLKPGEKSIEYVKDALGKAKQMCPMFASKFRTPGGFVRVDEGKPKHSLAKKTKNSVSSSLAVATHPAPKKK